MNFATKSTHMRIWAWLVWALLILALLTAPQILLQAGHPVHAVGVALQTEDAQRLYPWLLRKRWRKWAWRRYQQLRRRHQQAVRTARKVRLLLLGARSLAALFAVLTRRQTSVQVGSLPILYALLERLQVRRIINKHVPSRAQVDIGTVALVLTLNRLQAPLPLYRIADWVGRTVLTHLLGIDPAKFNDDRLARALDALAPHIEAIWEDVLAEVYRDKDAVEKVFRISKQALCVAPLHLHKDQRIQAMIFLNMIALLAHRLLAHQLHQQGVTASLQRIIRTLEETPLIESHFLDGSVLHRLAPLSDEAERFWRLAFEAVAALNSDTSSSTPPVWLFPSRSSQPPAAASPPFP